MILAVANQKGGTGKTTTVGNFGSALAKKGHNVLLVDFDPQASLSFMFSAETEPHIVHALEGDHGLEDVIIDREELQIVPGNITLADFELNLVGVKDRAFVLRELLSTVRESYDFILIDCPPSLSLLTINALVAADELLIPLQLEVFGIKGLQLILNTVSVVQQKYNPDLKIAGVLPVMVNQRRNLSNEVLGHIQKKYNLNIFNQQINVNVKISESPSFGKSVIRYAPASKGARQFQEFSNQFINPS